MQKNEIIGFYMGNSFDNRQVNNFLVNHEVMSTCKNKLLLFIKIRSITIELQLNYNSLNFKLVSTILGIFLWNFQVTFLKYVSFGMCEKIDFCPLKNNSYF